MTLAAFCIAWLAAWAHYALVGRVVGAVPGFGPITVWTAWFAATLASAGVAAFRSEERQAQAAFLVLVANFLLGHAIWGHAADPVFMHGVLHAAIAIYFALTARTGREIAMGLCFVVAVWAGFLTFIDVLPDHRERARVFLALTYPDLIAACGHAAHVVLGSGHDAGARVRNVLARYLGLGRSPRLRAFRWLAPLAARTRDREPPNR